MRVFNPTKPVRTREGASARIICTDYRTPYLNGPERVIALIANSQGKEFVAFYRCDGTHVANKELCLINVPTKKWIWAIQFKNNNHNFLTPSYYTEAEVKAKYFESSIVGRILESEIEE